MIKLILLINIILVLNSTLLYIGIAAKGRCDRELYFNGCCPHTQWNPEKDMCEDCPVGYYWINCSIPCHYPFYGSKCGQTCSCEEENCNHMSGCKNEIKTSVMPSATPEVSMRGACVEVPTHLTIGQTTNYGTVMGIEYLASLLKDDLERPTQRNRALTVKMQILIALRFYESGSFLQVIGNTLGFDKITV